MQKIQIIFAKKEKETPNGLKYTEINGDWKIEKKEQVRKDQKFAKYAKKTEKLFLTTIITQENSEVGFVENVMWQ